MTPDFTLDFPPFDAAQLARHLTHIYKFSFFIIIHFHFSNSSRPFLSLSLSLSLSHSEELLVHLQVLLHRFVDRICKLHPKTQLLSVSLCILKHCLVSIYRTNSFGNLNFGSCISFPSLKKKLKSFPLKILLFHLRIWIFCLHFTNQVKLLRVLNFNKELLLAVLINQVNCFFIAHFSL